MSVTELIAQLKAMSHPATGPEKIALTNAINDYCTEHGTHLNLSKWPYTRADIENLSAVLNNTNVKALSLDFITGTPPHHSIVNALSHLLEHNSTLTTLSLSGNGLNTRDAFTLTTSLSKNENSEVTTLILDNNNIHLRERLHSTDAGYMAFIDSLADTKLKKISLQANTMCSLSCIGVEYLLKNTKRNTNLQEFNLDNNPSLMLAETNQGLFVSAILANNTRPIRSPDFLGSEMLKKRIVALAFVKHSINMKVRASSLGKALAQSTPLPLTSANIIKDYIEEFPGEFDNKAFAVGFKNIPVYSNSMTRNFLSFLPNFSKKDIIFYAACLALLSLGLAFSFVSGGPMGAIAYLSPILGVGGFYALKSIWNRLTQEQPKQTPEPIHSKAAPPPIVSALVSRVRTGPAPTQSTESLSISSKIRRAFRI